MSEVRSKRKRNYYKGPSKRKQYNLEAGTKGFLCSCNFREKDCIRESYNLLNEYADKLLDGTNVSSPINISENDPSSDENLGQSDEEDIQDALHKETESLKSEIRQIKGSRFQVVESGAKNCLFIRTTLEDPVQLAEMIIKDVYETKQQKTRFLLRLVPIEITCKANVSDIVKSFTPLLEKYMKSEAKSYGIMFNHRNNNQISKDEVIKAVAEKVQEIKSDHKVNLKDAEVSLIIEIIRNVALLAVVPNYLKYKKYNIHSVSSLDNSKNDQSTLVQTTESEDAVDVPDKTTD